MSAIDDLNAAVTSLTTSVDAAVTALGTASDSAAIEAAVASITADVEALNTAVGGGTGPGNAPVVTSISPSTGSVAGGNSVTVSGSGFTGATAVNFGTIAATDFAVSSDTTVVSTSPAFAAGTVDVTVVTPNGTSATSTADQYTAS